ncbi:MAG: flagellar hook-length control protein FliK [Bacteroidota bacterium]
MNFSNFIIEKLTETDASSGLGNKKTTSNPFLFADIIKICEQENEAKQSGVVVSGTSSFTQEVFSANDNIVNLNEQDFLNLTKQISDLFSSGQDLQPTKINHKVDSADITKLQFVISDNKLAVLAENFMDKTGYSLFPLNNLSESSSYLQPLSVSYKNGANKISITLSPILVDENSTSKAIQDDFNFVNKLLVAEGLINNTAYFTSEKAAKAKNNSEKEAGLDVNSVSVVDDEANFKLSDKVFYKAEIIKIDSLLKLNDRDYSDELKYFANSTEISELGLPFRKSVSPSHNSEYSASEKSIYPARGTESTGFLKIEESLLSDYNKHIDAITSQNSAAENSAKSDALSASLKTDSSVEQTKISAEKITVTQESASQNKAAVQETVFVKNNSQSSLAANGKILTSNFSAQNSAAENSAKSDALSASLKTDSSVEQTKISAEKITVTQESASQNNATVQETVFVKSTASYKNGSVNKLMSGLTDEEKSVFKIYNTSGEHQEINYTKVSVSNSGFKHVLSKHYEALNSDAKQVSKNSSVELTSLSDELQVSALINDAKEQHVKTDTKKVSNKEIETAETRAKVLAVENPLEIFSDGKLHLKVNTKTNFQIESYTQGDTEEVRVKQNSTIESQELSLEEKPPAKEIKIVLSEGIKENRSKGAQTSTLDPESAASNVKDITVNQKVEADVKEQVNVSDKEVKVSSGSQQYSQGEKESGKSNSSENFKNYFNQTIASEKSLDLESIKLQAEPKHSNTVLKTIKQQEILPELSKMVLNGERQTMTLQLTPENLGRVKLTVDMIDNQIITKIEVESEQVKQFVQSNLDQLKQNMQSAGVPLTNVNVSLSDEQKNQKLFTQKKKSLTGQEKEDIIEEVTRFNTRKQMGYNTYEFTA